MKILATVLGKTSKNFEIIESDKTIHHSTQSLMLIPNMIVLLHKTLVLMMKIEIYGPNSGYLTQNSEKTNFFSNQAT